MSVNLDLKNKLSAMSEEEDDQEEIEYTVDELVHCLVGEAYEEIDIAMALDLSERINSDTYE